MDSANLTIEDRLTALETLADTVTAQSQAVNTKVQTLIDDCAAITTWKQGLAESQAAPIDTARIERIENLLIRMFGSSF